MIETVRGAGYRLTQQVAGAVELTATDVPWAGCFRACCAARLVAWSPAALVGMLVGSCGRGRRVGSLLGGVAGGAGCIALRRRAARRIAS